MPIGSTGESDLTTLALKHVALSAGQRMIGRLADSEMMLVLDSCAENEYEYSHLWDRMIDEWEIRL